MLPKKERLSRVDFDTSFKQGRRHTGTYVTLVVESSPTAHGSVVVGKKVFKSAVSRNRLRRRIYPLLRAHFKKISKGYTCIVLTKPSCTQASFEDIRADVLSLLGRVE